MNSKPHTHRVLIDLNEEWSLPPEVHYGQTVVKLGWRPWRTYRKVQRHPERYIPGAVRKAVRKHNEGSAEAGRRMVDIWTLEAGMQALAEAEPWSSQKRGRQHQSVVRLSTELQP